ncbi:MULTISPECIES: response regulator transcription factor [unclassified Streptomyces]|uniref:response regulator n=1 Tax=unclassified Streptomyces TaxID=2593676 RepID=UPI00089CDC5E|nr:MULTISPECIES: response regulator transcription factor [unclassified Streptomyces]WSX91761.1 response regulator transcription factor [Streptomyces sp. NBC_00891]WSY06238.1 response regulator transcription factor [Streptomyces sp. NBC_00890]WSZ07863.1 response regulator transcription factor [Streptomyces sp. NBC_00869]WSZ24638.1 response regulator transcription factor [Streptomyces sp. NBC_00870]SED28122.1 two component transcriptional regulator, LuxR family [Streptomyces sp. 2131.1]
MSAPDTPESVRILVADDHTLLREALCDLLRSEPGFEIVAQAGNGEDAIRLAAAHRPDVVLLDIEMPRNDPPATVRRLLQGDPGLRIIVLSMYDGQQLVQELLHLGISGYLHKSTGRETLISAVRSREGGELRTVTVSVSPDSLRAPQPVPDSAGGLSDREAEVLTLVAQAMSNRQIAVKLGIAEGTIKRHMRNIFTKLDAVSRIDAVNKAVERGLLPQPDPPRRRF